MKPGPFRHAGAFLENLVGCRMPIEDRLRPDRQVWRAGDRLWMYPSDRAGGVGFAPLRHFVPGRALAFGTHAPGRPVDVEDGSWSFVLVPLDDSTTRLLVRGRIASGRSLLGAAFDGLLFEPVHFVMERRMMIGLKQLAEGADRGRRRNHAHVLLWVITFALLVTAAVRTVRQDAWKRPALSFLTATVVFQVLTLGQPHLVIGIVFVIGLGALMWSPARTRLVPEPGGINP